MVETEFLFGFQPKDRRYDIISKILKAYAATKPFPVYFPVSALIEIREINAESRQVGQIFFEVKRISFKEFLKLMEKQ
jgi:hypothetical protein